MKTSTSRMHTPGPWSVETKGSKHFIDGDDGLTVGYIDRAGVRDRATIEANARLIAIAPELLDALRALIAADTAICENVGTKSDQAMQRIAALDAADRAIAKAEGQG